MMRLSTIRPKAKRPEQSGSALVLVVFIIVVIVGFVANLSNRNQIRNSEQLIASVVGTRAEMAARAASQIEISRFYQNAGQGSCLTSTDQAIVFQGEGLEQCSASVRCIDIGQLDNGFDVYQIVATGTCQVGGDWQLQRVIEVGVRDEA